MCVHVCERRLSVDSDAECDQNQQYYFGHRNRSVLSFSLTMYANAFNAPPARRIIGYQCTNPHCGKSFLAHLTAPMAGWDICNFMCQGLAGGSGLKQAIVDADADMPPEGLPVARELQAVTLWAQTKGRGGN